MSYKSIESTSNNSRILLLLTVFILLFPQYSTAQGLDEKINDAFMPFAEAWESLIFFPIQIGEFQIPIVLIMLVGGALFFTFYFRFINLRLFPLAIGVVRGKFDSLESKVHASTDIQGTIKNEAVYGEVNHFEALTTAISGTVGLGNISMVAVAISIGGPGATFWMIMAGLLGMSSKFVECTLGVKYREYDQQGQVYGGPMYYLRNGLKDTNWKGLGKVLSICFAILCVGASLGGGNAFQSNQAAAQLISRFEFTSTAAGTVIGFLFALVAGIVILGGIKSIGRVTSRLVPLMAGIYLSAAMFILISNYSLIDDALIIIFSEALTPRAGITGGIVGVMIQGFRRAAFSNEAGAGSAAIAHAAVKTNYPASEGLVALLEPFIDTVLICTMTALVIIIFNIQGVFNYGDVVNNEVLILETGARIGGVNITSMAFDHSLPGFSYVLVVAVVLFAFSTIISWSYYGIQSWKYLFGRSRFADISFKVLFLSFTVLGSAVTLDAVIKFSDAMILALVFPNMIGLLLLYPHAKKELDKYLTRINEQLRKTRN